jgi:PAS domain S-box-containing protein
MKGSPAHPGEQASRQAGERGPGVRASLGPFVLLGAGALGFLLPYAHRLGRALTRERQEVTRLEALVEALRRRERELRLGEAHLRQVLEGLKDHALIVLDAEGRVVSWSRGAERLKGYRAEEIIGRSVAFIHEGEFSHPGMVREALAKAAADGHLEVESWCLRKDGSRFLSEDSVFPVWTEDGRLRGFSVVSRDVTERYQARTRLRRSEARYRLVSRATQESIWDWDLLGNRMEWGEGALGRFGYSEEEDASDPRWWEAHLHPDDRQETVASLEHVIQSGEERWTAEYRFLCANGSHAWVRDAGYVVREDGRPVRMIGAMSDITRRRRAEEERSRLYREAQEAIRMRDEFLSVASHELKTPITALQLNLQTLRVLAQKGEGSFTPERALKKLTLAEHQVLRLARLVNDLLDLSRVNSGQMELRFETVDVTRLVHELVDRQRAALQSSGSEVRLQLQEAGLARVDPMRLEQLLTNLLSNAAKYGQGKPIDVTLEGEEAGYRIRVRDRGIGIAPEDQQRIFERFERAVSERHYGGLGLGLWITRRIARGLGGSIEVHSQPGEGATFELHLPRFPPEAHLAGSPHEARVT